MSASKTDRIEEEIDSSRCHGQWQKLPKLAKKISKYPNYSGQNKEIIIIIIIIKNEQ